MNFGQKLELRTAQRGQVCVGIDPHPALLESWGLPDTPAGLEEFGLTVVGELGGDAAAYKPQSAFYERHGSAGIAVLERLLKAIGECGSLSILDVKRGDIGSTMAGYAQSYLRPGAPLEADAITVSPYLGFGSLAPAFETAIEYGKGLFVLGLTSNPEGASVQHATSGGEAVAKNIIDSVKELNSKYFPKQNMGSIGLVIGATIGNTMEEIGIDLTDNSAPVLAPGVGAQGGGKDELKAVFGKNTTRVLASASRSILRGGPKPAGLRNAFYITIKESSLALSS